MFEQAHYSLGFMSIKVFLIYFFYVNLGLLLFASLGLLVEKITKIAIPSVIKILAGYAVYTSLAWRLHTSGHSRLIVPTLVSLVLCITVSVFMDMKQRRLGLKDIVSLFRDFLTKLTPLFVIEVVLIGFWTGFLNDKPYHILVYGNNDVYFWGYMSDHVMGISSLERIREGANNFLSQVIDCFGVYSWLGLMGKISMKSHSVEAVMLFQLSLSVLLAWIIYEISRVVVGVKGLATFIPAFVFSFNPLWVYIFTNNFLSQLIATFCFLSCIYIMGLSDGSASKTKNNVVTGLMVYVCFVFSYPGLLVPYLVFVAGSIAVFNYFLCRARGCELWRELGATMAGVAVGMLIGAVMFFDITTHALGRFTVLSGIAAGWVHSMVDPLNLIGLITRSLDHTFFSNWITYLVLVSLMCFVLISRNRGSKERPLSEARYDSLLFLSIVALIGYLVVYYIKGDGYQQWKFATYFPLPLLLLVFVNYLSSKVRLNRIVFYLIFSFVVIGSMRHLIQEGALKIPSKEFVAVQSLDNKTYDSITLGLEPYKGIMLAANFLGSVNLYSLEDSYLPKIRYNPERITDKNPLLTTTDSCLISSAIDFRKISEKLVLISKVDQQEKNVYSFNMKPYCSGMQLDALRGLSGIEPWGAWSDGERTEFRIAIDESYPRGGILVLNVRPVINPKIADDARMVEAVVDSKYRKIFKFSSGVQSAIEMKFDEKKPGSVISLVINHFNPIRFSDMGGNDPRKVSLGFLSAKLIDANGAIMINSTTGGYDRETDGKNWWHWVARKVRFELKPLFVPKKTARAKLNFEYGTRGKQTLTMHLIKRDGSSLRFTVQGKGNGLSMFEKIIDLQPNNIAALTIETDGAASRLGEQDPRKAAWIIRNVNIKPVSN